MNRDARVKDHPSSAERQAGLVIEGIIGEPGVLPARMLMAPGHRQSPRKP